MTFDFFNVPRIIFGRGVIARLGEFIPAAARTLLIYNGRRVGVPGAVAEFHQRGEPTVADIDQALKIGRDERCDFVIGLGGGSAIDAAKAVAGLLANGGVASDYMEVVGKGQKITKPAVPWIAIPTTAGTGAEVTRNAVIGWPEKKLKASIRSERLMARVALIDPELHVDVPREITARSGADALCQCIEAYVSTGANPMTDAVALKGVELARRYLQCACDDGRDLEAREGMALAALLSGIALTNAGLGAVHGFAAPLGANFPIPHGAVCGVLLPHVIDANIAALRQHGDERGTLAKYAEIQAKVDVASVLAELNLPPLTAFGFTDADVAPMVDLARRASSMRYNPVTLSDAASARILLAGMSGRGAESGIVRDFTPADAPAFRRLNEEWLARYFAIEPKDLKVLSEPQSQILRPGGAILVLEVDREVIGCCALMRLDDRSYELAKMAVTERHQGKGFGKRLLCAAIDRARNIGASRLYLESNSKLAAALALYRHVGFVDVPPRASAYERVDVYMELRLNGGD